MRPTSTKPITSQCFSIHMHINNAGASVVFNSAVSHRSAGDDDA